MNKIFVLILLLLVSCGPPLKDFKVRDYRRLISNLHKRELVSVTKKMEQMFDDLNKKRVKEKLNMEEYNKGKDKILKILNEEMKELNTKYERMKIKD